MSSGISSRNQNSLRKLRQKAGFETQQEFVDKYHKEYPEDSGFCAMTLSNYETGKTRPRKAREENILKLLGSKGLINGERKRPGRPKVSKALAFSDKFPEIQKYMAVARKNPPRNFQEKMRLFMECLP